MPSPTGRVPLVRCRFFVLVLLCGHWLLGDALLDDWRDNEANSLDYVGVSTPILSVCMPHVIR